MKTGYTSVLMQVSGTMTVESTIGSFLPKYGGKLLIVINVVYGKRIVQIVEYLGIDYATVTFDETEKIDLANIENAITNDITHVAIVHCETTNGYVKLDNAHTLSMARAWILHYIHNLTHSILP